MGHYGKQRNWPAWLSVKSATSNNIAPVAEYITWQSKGAWLLSISFTKRCNDCCRARADNGGPRLFESSENDAAELQSKVGNNNVTGHHQTWALPWGLPRVDCVFSPKLPKKGWCRKKGATNISIFIVNRGMNTTKPLVILGFYGLQNSLLYNNYFYSTITDSRTDGADFPPQAHLLLLSCLIGRLGSFDVMLPPTVLKRNCTSGLSHL